MLRISVQYQCQLLECVNSYDVCFAVYHHVIHLFTVINCSDPGTPLNGQQADVKNGYSYGGSVKFTCKNNHTLSGRSQIFCEETKDWTEFANTKVLVKADHRLVLVH